MIFIFAFFVMCHFGTNFAFESNANLAKCAGLKDSFWGKITKKIDENEIPEELICELSRTDALINTALNGDHEIEFKMKNGAAKLRENDPQMFSMIKTLNEEANELKINLMDNHQQMNSQQIKAINSSVFQLMDKMATKFGVKLSDVKPMKFENRAEMFKSVLNLLKIFNQSKNDLLSNNGMIENIFGMVKALLEQSNFATLKGQRRRAKRAIDGTNLILIIVGSVCAVIFLVGLFLCRTIAYCSNPNPN